MCFKKICIYPSIRHLERSHTLSPPTHTHTCTHTFSLFFWCTDTFLQRGNYKSLQILPTVEEKINSLSSMSQWKCTPNFNLSSHCNIKPQLKTSSTLNTGTYKTNKLFFIWGGSQKYWLHEVYMGLPVAFETTTSSGSYPELGSGKPGALGNGRTVGRVAGGRVTDVILKALIYDFFSLRWNLCPGGKPEVVFFNSKKLKMFSSDPSKRYYPLRPVNSNMSLEFGQQRTNHSDANTAKSSH